MATKTRRILPLTTITQKCDNGVPGAKQSGGLDCPHTVHCGRAANKQPIVAQQVLRLHCTMVSLIFRGSTKSTKAGNVPAIRCPTQTYTMMRMVEQPHTISTASLSVPLKAASTLACAKLAVNLFSPMPSVIVSKGFLSRLPSASSLVNSTPRLTCQHIHPLSELQWGLVPQRMRECTATQERAESTKGKGHALLYKLEPGGSIRYTWIPWFCPLRKHDTPAIVPPVPAPDTKASTVPPVCRQISSPAPFYPTSATPEQITTHSHGMQHSTENSLLPAHLF